MDPLVLSALGGIFRAVITTAVGYAAAKGYIGGDTGGDVIAALTTIGVAGWSVAQKATAAKTLQTATGQPATK